MLAVFNITAPVFLVIALGYVMVGRGVFDFEELRGTAKFVMKIGLPALVFSAIAGKPFREVFDVVYLAGYGAATFAVFAAGWLVSRRLRRQDAVSAALSAFAVSFSNTGFIGYPLLAMTIGAQQAAPFFAMNVLVENMFLIPVFFILADSAAEGSEGRLKNLLRVLSNLLKNPIILALFAALPFALGWLPLPKALLATASVLAAGSGPVALFVIGGSLVGLRLAGGLRDILWMTAGKLLAFPLLVVLFLKLFGADGGSLFAGALLAGVPTASMVAIIHNQYGHGQRGAAVMLATTILSFFVIAAVLLAWHRV